MQISVIICTYNRSESLKDTLDSLIIQENGKGFTFEVIIVDNNSKDNTKDTVMSLLSKFKGKLRYVFESNPGLSYARNTGIRASNGAIIVFTDDDVITSETWLKNIYSTFVQFDADCVFGKILPAWENATIPKWLEQDKKLWRHLALLDYGDNVVINPQEQFFGANFSIKKDILAQIGNFNINLGRKEDKLFIGEETEIFYKLCSLNKKIIYNPRIFVLHKIGSERTTRGYFKKWNFDAGQSFAFKFLKSKNTLLGIPLWVIKEFFVTIYLLGYYSLMLNFKASFRFKLKYIFYCGAILSFLKQTKFVKSYEL